MYVDNQKKTLFVYYLQLKLPSAAAAAAKKTAINVRTGQDWPKKNSRIIPNGIFSKNKPTKYMEKKPASGRT